MEGIFNVGDVEVYVRWIPQWTRKRVNNACICSRSISMDVAKWRGKYLDWISRRRKVIILNQLATLKAFHDGWKFAVFSPENMPMNDFFNDIIEMYAGKSSDPFHGNLQMPIEGI